LDSQQIKQLTERYGASLVLYARQWCQQPDDALQNALIDLLQLDVAPDDPAAWLFTTVRRKAHNIARTEKRLADRHAAASQTRQPWFEADTDRQIMAAEIERSLETLPDLERQIVVARIWGELNFEQIAEVTNKSSSSVHRRYKHALTLLAAAMREHTKERAIDR